MPTSNRSKKNMMGTSNLMAFFTVDNKFCGVKTKTLDYQLFRCSDGHLVCTLDHRYLEFAFSLGAGGVLVVVGIIDLMTRKCAPWSIIALMAFTRDDLTLAHGDLCGSEDKIDSIMILGSPMPALFPMLLRRF